MSAPDGGVEVGVYGLRTFRVHAGTGELLPVVHNQVGGVNPWDGTTCVATCVSRADHTAPVENCSCGIYSFADLETLRGQYGQAMLLVAVVALEGTVIEGARGTRAQAARVVAIWTQPGALLSGRVHAQMIDRLGDVTVYDDVDAMIEAYPGLRHTPATESVRAVLVRSPGQLLMTPALQRRRHLWRGVRRGPLWWLATVYLYAVLFSAAHQLHLDTGPRAENSIAEVLTRLQQQTTHLGGPDYTAPLIQVMGILAVLAVVALAGLGLMLGRGVPAAVYTVDRFGRRVIRTLAACALAAALVGAPTALSTSSFWITLTTTLAMIVGVRVLLCTHALRSLVAAIGIHVQSAYTTALTRVTARTRVLTGSTKENLT